MAKKFRSPSPAVRQKIAKRLPIALGILGAAGVVGTAITSAQAAVKAYQYLEREHLLNATKWEKIKASWRFFMLPVGVGASTMASTLSGVLISTKQMAGLLAGCETAKLIQKEYREQVKKLLGSKMEDKLNKSVERTTTADSNECLFYLDFGGDGDPAHDQLHGLYFNAEMIEVIDAFYRLNYLMAQRGSVSVNTLLALLGQITTMDGEIYGWIASDKMLRDQGFCWVDFNLELIETDDGLECYAISFEPGSVPIKNYLDI